MPVSEVRNHQETVIGLIPAAGKASRIAPLPCSKELFPIGFRNAKNDQGVRPRVACHYLFEKMREAGIKTAYVILTKGKWDIPAYLGAGAIVDMQLAYIIIDPSCGVPFTINHAHPFVKDHLIAFGFPDIIFSPGGAFASLLESQASTQADVVLGLFPATKPPNMDMVDVDSDGRVRLMVLKPAQTKLKFAWVVAVWTPVFTHFMHDYLAKFTIGQHELPQSELSMGEIFQAAVSRGLHVQAVVFPNHTYLDIGTPDDLAKAVGCTGIASA
jgi:glucose-1-phosphate thymidylyltransferase